MPLLQKTVGDRQVHLQAEELVISVKEAASLCVLVNELVSNAAKHGQSDITLTLEAVPNNGDARTEKRARLEVCDAGPGFPAGFDPHLAGNTGMELVESAARWDLHGEIAFENRAEGGARVVVTFPLPDIGAEEMMNDE